jgi:hypothetical protein
MSVTPQENECCGGDCKQSECVVLAFVAKCKSQDEALEALKRLISLVKDK